MHPAKKILTVTFLAASVMGIFMLFAQTEKTEKPPAVPALVDRESFKARGRNETILHIPRIGRYSIQVKSGQGTRIELVDRMAGMIGSDGVAGQNDGRLDIVLDKGDYKLRLLSHRQGSGEVQLKVLPFSDVTPVVDPADHPMLTEQEMVNTTLGDLQQRSFWLELKSRRVLNLEIQGRALTECRLWRDGALWEEIAPTLTVYEPEPGKPMTHIEFHHELNPGLYLLRCYGGPLRKWTEEKGEAPLYLRWGVQNIGENGQRIFTLSPFGRDVFIVGSQTNFFQLVRSEKKPTRLSVRAWITSSPRHKWGLSADISKESRDPWCKVKNQGVQSNVPQIVIVQGKPGDALELDYFRQVYNYDINNIGSRYWISSIHSAEARDALDVTAVLFNYRQKTTVKEQLPTVGPNQPLVRRVNLLDIDTIFVYIAENGAYTIDENKESGASADYQITPFMIFRPNNYREPPFLEAGKEWNLVAGYYIMTLRPKSKGILHFALHRQADLLTSSLKALFSRNSDPLKDKPGATTQGFFWPDITFEYDTRYYLQINQRSGVESGIILRPLPVNLEEPLPVTLAPGQKAQIKAMLDKPCRIELLGPQGRIFNAGSPLANASVLLAGQYELAIENRDKASGVFNLVAIPVVSPPAKPMVKNIEAILPILEENQPVFADFERSEIKEYLLRVKEPAYYRLETTGLLAFSLRVRTFVTSTLFDASENGIGRNALVQQYLKPGDYIVTMQALGQTMGRAGLRLRKTPVQAVDELSVDSVSRRKVPADTTLRYRFHIPQAGKYHLESMGLGKNFAFRLEEAGGWPLIVSSRAAFIERLFDAGTYTLLSLPEPVESRRVTYLKPLIAEKPVRGKGPHALEVNRPLQNIWMEATDQQPDIYTLKLTAPIQARITLGKDLEATLEDSNNKAIAHTSNGNWEGLIPMDTYQIKIRASEKTNRLPYTLSLSTDDFIPGMKRTISTPTSSLSVSLGEGGMVEISSFGRQDCRAWLKESESGAVLAQSDDTPTDWNFSISRELSAGRYRLDIESQTSQNTPYEVRMNVRTVRTIEERPLPFAASDRIGVEILKIPFVTGANKELVHFYVSKSASARIAVTKENRVIAEGEREIYIPLAPNQRYMLLAWREGDQMSAINLKAETVAAALLSIGQETGIEAFRAAQVEALNGFSLEVTAVGREILYSPSLEIPCLAMGEPGEKVFIGSGWLALAQEGKLRLKPFTLKVGGEESIRLGDIPLSLAVTASGHPLLLECESADSLVGMRLMRKGTDKERPFRWSGVHIDRSYSLLGIPESGEFRGDIRRLAAEAGGQGPERVTLRLRAFPLQPFDEKKDEWEIDLNPGRAVRLAVKEDEQVLRLVLPRDTVAFNWSGNGPAAIVAAIVDNTEFRMLARKGFLYVLNRGEAIAPVHLRRDMYASTDAFVFNAKKGFEDAYGEPGQIRLAIEDIPPGQILCVIGDDIQSYFLTPDGQMLAAKAVKCLGHVLGFFRGNGLLVVDHGPGLVKIWLSPENQLERTFMGDLTSAKPGDWDGEMGVLKNQLQKWSVDIRDFSMLISSMSPPGVMALFQEGRPVFIWVSSLSQNRYFQLLPGGNYTLYTRPLAGHFQEGFLTFSQFSPRPLVPPGPEKDLLIEPFGIQAFRFPVKAKGMVGVGLKCDSDRLYAAVFNQKLETVGVGPLIVRELEAGDYYLVVMAFESPVRFRPIILGSEGSLREIPTEVLQEYVK